MNKENERESVCEKILMRLCMGVYRRAREWEEWGHKLKILNIELWTEI